MLSEQKKREQLERILCSLEFKDSKSYKNLLSYLVETSLTNEIATEASIAIDGLGKKENFDNSTDASVRVYIHNLRKKLASYYLNEGKFDTLKLSIPKGQHYQVLFTAINKPEPKKFFISINASIIAVIIILNVLFWVFNKPVNNIKSDIPENSMVWNEFHYSGNPILLVYGDFFIFKDTSKSVQRYIRDFRINSMDDLKQYNIENPDSVEYLETELSFLGKSSVDTFPDILKPLFSWNKKVNVKLSSELTWDDIANNNIIFIGSFKTLGILNSLMVNLNSSYRIHPNTIFYKDEEVDSVFEYKAPKDTKTGFLKDHALVAKLPGPNSNTIIIFTGTHDIGQSATLASFTNSKFLTEFEKNFDAEIDSKKLFEAVFEVQGFERTGFHPNLIHFNELPDDFVIGEFPQ